MKKLKFAPFDGVNKNKILVVGPTESYETRRKQLFALSYYSTLTTISNFALSE